MQLNEVECFSLSVQASAVKIMGDNLDRTFYIPVERLLEKHTTIPDDEKQKRIAAICTAIKAESGETVTLQFRIEDNLTLRFSLQGPIEQVSVAIGLLERHLIKERRQDRQLHPQHVVALTVDNLREHNHAMMKSRQFACQPCNNVWWRKVFSYKPVSRCQRCHVRYNAVPTEHEFGWGRFRCHCGNVFSGFAEFGRPCICHGCQAMVLPQDGSIGPKRRDGPRPPTRNRHACDHCNFGRIHPCPGYNRVLHASQPHINTGSTASTFLTQESFAYREPMN